MRSRALWVVILLTAATWGEEPPFPNSVRPADRTQNSIPRAGKAGPGVALFHHMLERVRFVMKNGEVVRNNFASP